MIKATTDAGICGFTTTIEASSEDMQMVHLNIESGCPDIQALAAELGDIDAMGEAFGKVGDTHVYQIARKHCKHAACPVPMAIVKAVEASAGLALPKDTTLIIKKMD